MTSLKDPPERLTRFYGNTDYALDVIANRQITFVHISTLNDPFDPYFFMETDFRENYHELIKFVRTHHPRDLGWFQQHITPLSWLSTIKALKEKIESYRAGTFIFAASGDADGRHPRDSLYMWGHYGNGHRGVAVEFNTHEITRACLKHHEDLNGSAPSSDKLWVEISYSTNFAPITAANVYAFLKQEYEFNSGRITERASTELEDYYARIVAVKGDVWKAEREWRLMWKNDQTRMKIHKCPIGADAIAALYLGYNLSEAHGDDFIFEARRQFPQAKVLRAKKRHGDFALDFEEL